MHATSKHTQTCMHSFIPSPTLLIRFHSRTHYVAYVRNFAILEEVCDATSNLGINTNTPTSPFPFMDTPSSLSQCLSDDYAKLVFLGADRSLTFHAAFGMYYSTRVPRFGRDMLYDRSSCDLYVCGSSSDVYRLNLEQGTFRLPFQTSLPGVNTMAQADAHRLLVLAGDNGVIECWDPRAKTAVRTHDVAEAIAADGSVSANQNQATALSFSESGLNLLVGTHSGHCALYDIRSSRPLIIKEHQYATPIKKVAFQKGGQLAMSADAKVIKMWDTKTVRI
jgi:ribosome biogenesis protein ENP2